jgi:hypothetical protein
VQRPVETMSDAAPELEVLRERTPLVGRERNRPSSDGILDWMLTGHSGIALVGGEAGICENA